MSEPVNIVDGTEEGWRSASTDSRRHDKHRTIKALVDRMAANQEKAKAAQEETFYADLVEAAGPVVRAGLENTTLGYSRAYAAKFDRAFNGGTK